MSDRPVIPWAKLSRDQVSSDQPGIASRGAITGWLSLVDHSADVAAVFEAILAVPLVARRLASLARYGRLDEQTQMRLCVFAALHDFGKANNGFQARWDSSAAWIGHVHEGLIALKDEDARDEIVNVLPFGDMEAWNSFEDAICVALGHHGRPLDPQASGRDDKGLWCSTATYSPIEALRPLSTAVRSWSPIAFRPGGAPLPNHPPFWHAVSGLLTLADWIASDENMFPLLPLFDGGDGAARMEHSRMRVGGILQKIGFDPQQARQTLPSDLGFAAVSEYPPRPMQIATGEWQGSRGDAHIVVLESETGSGKTEAAIYRFTKLFEAGEVDGLYFALPTRVAATSLHRRVQQAVARIFPDLERRPHVVLAVPGAGDASATSLAEPPLGLDFWEKPQEAAISGRWAAERPKKYMAGTIAVGTIDQALLGIIRVKHAHLRLASLMRHLLVVDEVHASDLYMSTLLGVLLRFHRAAGGHALLLSATLGAKARVSLLSGPRAEPPPLAEAIAAPYPALSSDRDPAPLTQAWEGREKHVSLNLSHDIANPEAIARRALEAAKHNAKVIVSQSNCKASSISISTSISPASVWQKST